MSKCNDDFSVNLPLNDLMDVCKGIISKLGWAVLDQSSSKIRCKETGKFDINKGNFFADIEIVLASTANGTSVSLNGSNFGIGPFASKHIQGEVSKLRNMIEVDVKQYNNNKETQSANSNVSVAGEIEKLASLHSQGILSDDEFKTAKNKLLGI